MCNQGGPGSVNKLLWFSSCLCAIRISGSSSLGVNKAEMLWGNILPVRWWLQRSGDFWSMSHAIDLNLAEAYLALFLRTYSRPLFGNLSLWDISLPRVGKRISLALKTTFKKLDGNAACNLETWEIICKFHFYKSNWHSFSFSAIGPNDPLPGKNIIFLAAMPVPVPSLLKAYEAFKKGKSSSANQRTDYCSEVGWQVSLQINILPMHIYGLESQVLTL